MVSPVKFLFPVVRNSPRGQMTGAVILLLGMIMNRFILSWFAVSHLNDVTYVPNWMGPSVSVAIFPAGILALGLAAKYLPVFEDEHHTAHAHTGS